MDKVRDKSEEKPEIVAEEQNSKLAADQRMQESPAFQRAKDSKKKTESAAYKSRMRTLKSMQGFFGEVTARKQASGWRTKTFDNPEKLERDSDEYVSYCLEHNIVPIWNLFAVWMNCDVQTLYAEESLSTKFAGVLKKLRNRLFTILEQFSLQTEGNPASPIFHEKAQYGLSDQQPLDINLHTDAPRQASAEELQQLIETTPVEPSKHSLPGE